MQAPQSEEIVKETHLSYPEPSTSKEITPPPSNQPRQILKDRLYIGNLHSTVDEYVLLQVFSKFGKVSKLDFLFHKSGPLKGKPRGYAFLEYADPDDAAKAVAAANDKLLRGRKLMVTYAQQAPLDQTGASFSKHKRLYSDTNKPTTLSILKGVSGGRPAGTDDKIAKMEAKLRQLERTPASGSSLQGHPSLPPKPMAATLATASLDRPTASASTSRRSQTALPALPLAPPQGKASTGASISRQGTPTMPPASGTSHPFAIASKKGPLAGVVLKKRKDPPPS